MYYDNNIREEALKLKVASDWFSKYDCTDIVSRIDFAVKVPRKKQAETENEYLLWAEAKQQPTDVYKMLAQLILTIFQDARNAVPPKFIGCFDNEKIAFVQYHYVLPIFNLNDFNWTQTPSAVDDKTVETVRRAIDHTQVFSFSFDTDKKELQDFVKQNFTHDDSESLLSTKIDRNNFIFIYQKWRTAVMPYVNADWDLLKKNYSIYDRDFFLAELNIDDNGTPDIADDMYVNEFYITFNAQQRKQYCYRLNRKDALGLEVSYEFEFRKGGIEKYIDFWKHYKRAPQKEEWDFIIDRLDLLVPQDVRERKGAFFTPQIWVEKSQQYIADVLGDDWQNNYYVWDCCAGTGNLLNGLTNKYNIWASTLDQQDVDVMRDRIENGAQLLKDHVFQFDFLNDEFTKLPQGLQEIVNSPEKRQKLVIYINPPYAEATTATTVTGTGENKSSVAIANATYLKYRNLIGKASNELYAQFFIRIYKEITDCILAEFSTLKHVQSQNFIDFRNVFRAKLEKMFVVPANTFDNVKGSFPIGFFVWNSAENIAFVKSSADVYDSSNQFLGKKTILATMEDELSINKWIKSIKPMSDRIGLMSFYPPDFQNNGRFSVLSKQQARYCLDISKNNFILICIYLSVRQCIEANWLNDRDQFLYPNDGWKTDTEFQNDCLAFTLFHGQNRITSEEGINHWIPFTESEVNARDKFASNFMTDFMRGKCVPTNQTETELFATEQESYIPTSPLQFSAEATAVFDAGRALWQYYHTMEDANPNASLYDIKAYFQGRNDKGKMNTTSTDVHYMELIKALRAKQKRLAEKIQPKVYEYGFLK